MECQTTRQEKQYFLTSLAQNVTVSATTSLQLRATAGSDQVVVFRELESQYTRRLDRKRCEQRCTAGRPVNSDNHCSRKRMQQSKKNVNSHVFWILKKNVEIVKKRKSNDM